MVRRNLKRSPGAITILIAATLVVNAQTADPGRQEYEARCVGCHGIDGTGGGHGPAIVGAGAARSSTMQAVRDIIRNGIPETAMPAFAIPDQEVDRIAAYVMKLKIPAVAAAGSLGRPAGDVTAGEQFFNKKRGCAGCHMVRGRGGVLGPDLSDIGSERTLAQIEHSLAEHGTEQAAGKPYRAVSVHVRNGTTVRGFAKSESAFDLQLLGADGKLLLLSKDEIANVEPDTGLIPKLEITPGQTRDLVAYLSTLAWDPNATANLALTGEVGPGLSFADIAHPKPGEWPTYHGNESGNRFSALNQINRSNVGRLVPAWMFAVPGASRALEVTPIVSSGIMYVSSVNQASALDARSGREIWRYTRPRTKGVVGDAASGINRGVALLGDRVFMVTDNAHLIALHRDTGRLIWDVAMADYRQNYGSTSAPLVVEDLVIAGVSGGDEGVRGFVDAYKASSGEHAWRFWTVPARGEPGSETWDGHALEHGCASTWLTGTYDPEAKLIYWPTGNPCPDYNGDQRKGDNLYSDSVLALDPHTGKLRWHYQFTPHDLHDWDATETPMLVDAGFRGEARKLLLQGNRNGFFYVLDRLTGKVLVAEPFVKNLTWAERIGPDGRPILREGNEPTPAGQRVCPAVAGAANWPSTAFNPATGLFYMFAEESCTIYSKNDQQWEPGKSFYGGGTRDEMTRSEQRKSLKAIDIQTGNTRWEIPDVRGGILGSGILASAGKLLFYGDGSGAFVAADAENGKLLWHFNTGQTWKASPMTYTVNGKQYVAIAAGPTIIAFALE